jgi:glycosyltransferase involved in cell wall biosynthesis
MKMKPISTIEQPSVSIVLTTLNAAPYICEAVDSCLQQQYTNLELIVVDGGSTDETLDILRNYTDPRVRLIHQQQNAGRLPGAINLGLEHARGEYLTWMQGDSYYEPQAIGAMAAALTDHPEAGQVYADFWELNSEDHSRVHRCLPEPEEFLKSTGDPAGVCFLIRRSVRAAVGIHDVTTHPNHDFDYRMRIALKFSSWHIREPLYTWRFHPASLTARFGWEALARKDVEIRQKLGLSNQQEARHLLAEIDIACAFEQYRQGELGRVPRLVLAGLRRNNRFAANRGVWSILLKSLLRTPKS